MSVFWKTVEATVIPVEDPMARKANDAEVTTAYSETATELISASMVVTSIAPKPNPTMPRYRNGY